MKMPVLDVGLPSHISVHKSGGRDLWSPPMEQIPEDKEAALVECLHEVLDPEIPISLVDLGLIYGTRLEDDVAHIQVTPGDDLERLRMWQMVPPMAAAIDSFRSAVYEHGTLSVREREAARMRIAQINACEI